MGNECVCLGYVVMVTVKVGLDVLVMEGIYEVLYTHADNHRQQTSQYVLRLVLRNLQVKPSVSCGRVKPDRPSGA